MRSGPPPAPPRQSPPGRHPPRPAVPAAPLQAGREGGRRASSRCIEREEAAFAPHARRIAAFVESNLRKLVIDRPRKLGLEPVAHRDAWARPVLVLDEGEGILPAEQHGIAAVEPERDPALAAHAFA